LFAATYPERTSALALYACLAKFTQDRDYPWGWTRAGIQIYLTAGVPEWGTGVGPEHLAPSLATDEAYRRWFARLLRLSASPRMALALLRMNAEIDVRSILPSIRVPTLVLHRVGDLVVNSWTCDDLLEEHRALVRREIDRFRGREIDTSGDGFLAGFDGPARAIRCACAIADAMRSLGLEIRAGIDTGECEVIGERLAGIAVHVSARARAQAGPGEVLVSRTVRDLVAGSRVDFDDRGSHELKGVPGEQPLFAVRPDGIRSAAAEPVWSDAVEAAL
jgi:hypothetical protein